MTDVRRDRRKISAPVDAALWALSNGFCYAPGCVSPVIVEVRPGVPRKNAQVAHIYGVERNAPRYRAGMSVTERDSWPNLLLLCLPHHSEIDDPTTGEQLYSPDKLRGWKTKHEGSNGTVLASEIGHVKDDMLIGALEQLFSSPVERLQQIADQLERTGTLNVQTVEELRQVITVLTDTPAAPDFRTAALLMEAAEALGNLDLRRTASNLMEGAGMLGRHR
jgi:hypothetical protein